MLHTDTLPDSANLVNPGSTDDLSVDMGRVFDSAAELFAVLATPVRLRILNAICTGERSVTEIMDAVSSTQPNVSQHLKVLYQAGVVAKRRMGNVVLYRVQSEKAVQLCRTVCSQIAIELDDPEAVEQSERLARRVAY